jgi:hypothetical protein
MKLQIDVNLNVRLDQPEAPRWAQTLREMVSQILDNQEKVIMPTVDEVLEKAKATLAAVTAETDLNNAIAKVIDDKNATIAGLKAQLAAAGTDAAKLQELSDTMDAILAADTANDKIVADAITANTDAA